MTFVNHIYIKDNAIEHDYCNEVIKTLESSNLEKFKFYKGLKTIIPFHQNWFKNYLDSLNEYKLKYNFLDKGNISFWNTNNFCNYQKYESNENYGLEHCEHSYNFSKRILVYMFYCNDVKNGGETVFPQQDIKIKPKKGTIVFFPASWTHSHYGNPCNDIKYIVTGWCSYYKE